MKIKYLIIIITSLTLLFSACNDLDTLPLGNDVTSKQKEAIDAGFTELFLRQINTACQ